MSASRNASPGSLLPPAARPAGLDRVGVDRHDRVAGLHQRIDDHTRRTLDGDGKVGGRRQTVELLTQFGQPGGIMTDFKAEHHGAGLIDNADGMAGASPIQPAEI
jgi:hypothetical protein